VDHMEKVALRVRPEVMDRVRAIAEVREWTVQQLLRRLLLLGLDADEADGRFAQPPRSRPEAPARTARSRARGPGPEVSAVVELPKPASSSGACGSYRPRSYPGSRCFTCGEAMADH
jgi:hypothetical protein